MGSCTQDGTDSHHEEQAVAEREMHDQIPVFLGVWHKDEINCGSVIYDGVYIHKSNQDCSGSFLRVEIFHEKDLNYALCMMSIDVMAISPYMCRSYKLLNP